MKIWSHIISQIQDLNFRLENVIKVKEKYKELYDVINKSSNSIIPKLEDMTIEMMIYSWRKMMSS